MSLGGIVYAIQKIKSDNFVIHLDYQKYETDCFDKEIEDAMYRYEHEGISGGYLIKLSTFKYFLIECIKFENNL